MDKEQLIKTRQDLGLYTVNELCGIFCINRRAIDFALNSGKLKYMSPNNKQKLIYLTDFLEYMQEKGNRSTSENSAIATNKDLKGHI